MYFFLSGDRRYTSPFSPTYFWLMGCTLLFLSLGLGPQSLGPVIFNYFIDGLRATFFYQPGRCHLAVNFIVYRLFADAQLQHVKTAEGHLLRAGCIACIACVACPNAVTEPNDQITKTGGQLLTGDFVHDLVQPVTGGQRHFNALATAQHFRLWIFITITGNNDADLAGICLDFVTLRIIKMPLLKQGQQESNKAVRRLIELIQQQYSILPVG